MAFTIGNRNPARIPGDFQIAPAQAYAPAEPERAIIANVARAVDQLAAQAAADARATLRDSILRARVAFRAAQMAALRAVAEELVNGPADMAATTDRSAEILGRVSADVPDVTLADALPPRFDGEIALAVVNYAPDPAEQAYLDAQRELIDGLAADEAADLRANYSEPGLQTRRAQRTEVIGRLRETFTFWKSEELASDAAAANVSYTRGYYAAQRSRLGRKLFTVAPVRGTGEDAGYNVALEIRIAEGLPPPNDQPTQDQRDLYVEISRAETIIATVCRQIRARAHARFWSRPKEEQRGLRMLDEYIDKLVGIARIGLQQPHTALAKLAIDRLRQEFIAHEAREILNRYVRRLGAWSFGFAALFLLVYVVVKNRACDDVTSCASWWYVHRSFLLAAAGASLGTWASFSVRQVNLTFEQLAAPEEELLDAPLRIIFVVVLTMAACLLFWTGAINVKIGDLNTEASSFWKAGSVAILIGFFCGLSERALSSAIAGRATAFVGGIAGSR
ncbi:hypothetical protein [Bradyrhizobium liaoningense]|uniref:hypothetical protein n=2 Tax=Bradyrhizobium TaxID=374 RepID=UPI001BA67306|nr:hypothetical protein [Bradyrhizobium liaoningense]MBR0985275.1 hypothetical protein [Bradyrhizobium liaoningense]GMO93989.1 hypothetical protein TM239_04280 [Bradyrhizobium sp. TM239]